MKAANMERIAESDKRGCFMAGKCGSAELFAHFSAICAKKQLPQKRSPPEGACQPLCSAKRPPRPLVGDRRGFLHALPYEKPAKTPRFALWQIGEELIGAPSQANPIPRGAAPRPRKGGAARRAAASVKQSAPINTPPIYESADCGVLPRISGNRAWRKPRRTPSGGAKRGSVLSLREAFAKSAKAS